MQGIVDTLLLIVFGGTSIWAIGTTIAYMAGLWKLLTKCGLPGWHALIPGYREYAVARCADRERDGRVVLTIEISAYILYFLLYALSLGETAQLMGNVLLMLLGLVELIFQIRIRGMLCEIFRRRRLWIVGWMIPDVAAVVALIWGFRSTFQPSVKIQDLENEVANYFSGKRADVMEDGLTINLEERSVSDFFKKKYLLRDIHMYVKPGHMVLLLGGSGAGKTTLINAINGYEKAKAEVVLNGQNIYDEYKKMQYEIGFVPQQDLMRGSDTVLHTLLDAAMLRLPERFGKADRRKRVDEVMKVFGLTPVQNSLVEKLSGGQRKRLSIAMEFISNPSLFILDEPDSGLDGVMARALMQQLRSIADQGKIIIVITHTPDRVVDLFDDVIVLAKDANRTGRLAYFGPIEEARTFFEKERMEQIVRSINRQEEGGEGRADEFIKKYVEVQHE